MGAEQAALFGGLGLLGNIAILVASLILLDRTSDLSIRNSVKIADVTGFGRTTIGFTLVAFFSSLSALSVSVFSALGVENIDMAIGNALGSNIVNICLILGICVLLAALKKLDYLKFASSITREEVGNLYFGLFVASIIPLALIYIGYASRLIGAILIAIFVGYMILVPRRRATKTEHNATPERERLPRYSLLASLGGAGVVFSSFLILDSAVYIAGTAGMPTIIMGSTIVAFGTSLPVLAVSVGAVRRGHVDMAMGNIIGTCFMNTTFILGIPLVASTLRVSVATFSSLVMFSVITSLFLWYFLSSEKISWREGTMLMFMYFLLLTITFSGYKA